MLTRLAAVSSMLFLGACSRPAVPSDFAADVLSSDEFTLGLTLLHKTETCVAGDDAQPFDLGEEVTATANGLSMRVLSQGVGAGGARFPKGCFNPWFSLTSQDLRPSIAKTGRLDIVVVAHGETKTWSFEGLDQLGGFGEPPVTSDWNADTPVVLRWRGAFQPRSARAWGPPRETWTVQSKYSNGELATWPLGRPLPPNLGTSGVYPIRVDYSVDVPEVSDGGSLNMKFTQVVPVTIEP